MTPITMPSEYIAQGMLTIPPPRIVLIIPRIAPEAVNVPGVSGSAS